MSFSTDARTVRDISLPRERRMAAWRRCVRRYAPYGYEPTLRHLRERFGSLNDPAALAAALSALETSRNAWLAEVAEFHLRRRAVKAQGRRRVTAAELVRYRRQGWPGGEAAGGPRPASPADRPVTEGFLAAYGMALWRPEPVNHRRRVGRLPKVDPLSVILLRVFGCGGFTLALIAFAGWAIADPPAVAGWMFTVTGVLALAVLAWRDVSRSIARRNDTRRRRIMAMADAAEERWKADRERSSNLR